MFLPMRKYLAKFWAVVVIASFGMVGAVPIVPAASAHPAAAHAAKHHKKKHKKKHPKKHPKKHHKKKKHHKGYKVPPPK
jgi:ribosomal protein L12E/L44/L45/RPP1/RPP2